VGWIQCRKNRLPAVRRILVLTAEFGDLETRGPDVFGMSMIALGLLTIMTVAFVASLLKLRHRDPGAVVSCA
jgi:hypothetical protein